MDVNLKLLKAFEAVARNVSYKRAAAELGRSQSTLSIQIRELERQLEVRLLQRTTRQISLTEAGKTLLPALQRGIHEIEGGLSALRLQADARENRIILGCVPSLSSSRLPDILASFQSKQRTTTIDVRELTSMQLLSAILDEEVEFGIGPRSHTELDVTFTPILTEPICAVSRQPLVHDGRGLTLRALEHSRLVTLSGAILLQKTLEDSAREQGFSLTSHSQVQQVQTAIAMARAGLGVAIVPVLSLPTFIDSGLHISPILAPPQTRQLCVITKSGHPMSERSEALARHIRSELNKAKRDFDCLLTEIEL